VVERDAQPYVSIAAQLKMSELADSLGPLAPRIFARLGELGVEPAGPPFWKYNVIDMAGLLAMEVGVAVADPGLVSRGPSDEIQPGVLPAGRYAVVRHHGHPDGLEQATGDLLAWADRQGLRWDTVDDDGDERWVARLEEYLDHPEETPDMDDWDTDIVFKLADEG